MGRSDINLDGAEISIIKAIGLAGGGVDGKTMQERLGDLMFAELADSVRGLVAMGYVEADKTSYHNQEEFEKTWFHVNSGYAHDLKKALNPVEEPKRSKRVRRE